MNSEKAKRKQDLYEVPCANCGDSTFTFCPSHGAQYSFECRHCRKNTYVYVESNGGIKVRSEDTIRAMFEDFKAKFDPTAMLPNLCGKSDTGSAYEINVKNYRIIRKGVFAEVMWTCAGGSMFGSHARHQGTTRFNLLEMDEI